MDDFRGRTVVGTPVGGPMKELRRCKDPRRHGRPLPPYRLVVQDSQESW